MIWKANALASLIGPATVWTIDVERFRTVNHRPQQHVKARVAEEILADRMPETPDIMLVSIANNAVGWSTC
jgi:hypothetical protein